MPITTNSKFVRIAGAVIALGGGVLSGMFAPRFVPKSGILRLSIVLIGCALWSIWVGTYLWKAWRRTSDVPNKSEYKAWLTFETCCGLAFVGFLVYAVRLFF